MKVENKVIPSEEQMKGFVEGDIDSPISMLNLLKFKEKLSMRMAEQQISREEKPIKYML